MLVHGESQIIVVNEVPESGAHHCEKHEEDGKENPDEGDPSFGP